MPTYQRSLWMMQVDVFLWSSCVEKPEYLEKITHLSNLVPTNLPHVDTQDRTLAKKIKGQNFNVSPSRTATREEYKSTDVITFCITLSIKFKNVEK